jgi:hypothetical protein
MFTVFPFIILFGIYGTKFTNEDPELEKICKWYYIYFAISYFIYRILDEMDGK